MAAEAETVAGHYTADGLAERLLDAIAEAGGDPAHLTPDDLLAVDEFHVRGRAATDELAELAQLRPGWRVLDVGCGLGGAARRLATTRDVRVVGIDLTPELCRTARLLVERTGLADRVEIHQGDALELPFEDGSFDCAWTQHASMNIADKARLFAELRRVTRPGGTLAAYDIVAGEGGNVRFPVPWARDPSINFLVPMESYARLVADAGFEVAVCRDDSATALEWFRRMQSRGGSGPPRPVGLHLLLGPDRPRMIENQVRNLSEDRIRLVQLVARAV
jgi:SAM-dependent methyltransferase